MNYASRWSGGFKIPRRMLTWLEERLAGEQYKDAAMAIAGLTLRVWASPKHIGKEFPLSRLDVMRLLGLKEWHTRKGIDLLVAVGFMTRGEGGKPRRTGEGIRRPPRLYRLNAWIRAYFERLIVKRSGSAPVNNPPDGKILSSEKNPPNNPRRVLIGAPPPTPVLCKPEEDDPGLLAALARLGKGVLALGKSGIA